MDGYNKSFMHDPEGFMKKYCMDIPSAQGILSSGDDSIRPPKGHYDFDLYWNSDRNCIYLQHIRERRKAISTTTHLIHAYWLPWVVDQTVTIELGNDASFFFTSALDGCRIQVAGNQVAHIAGGLSRKDRIKSAQKLQDKAGQPTRRFSYTADYGGHCAFLIGFRKANAWRFLGQRFDIQAGGRHVLESVTTPAHGGVLWDSTRAAPDTFL